MPDSTVQVISYWDKGEKQIYSITSEEYKVKAGDTTSREVMHYDVEVTVTEVLDSSITVEWIYRNMQSDSKKPIMQKILNATKDMRVVFKTDELGVFREVINWEEVSDYIRKATADLRKEYSNIPEMTEVINQIEATYGSRKAIESAGIADIQQFHTFHGARYKLGEVLQGTIQVPNILGKDPFDSDFSLYLDEINEAENTYVMRASQEINKEQLTEATLLYLTTLSKSMKVDPPSRTDIGQLSNNTQTASRLHGSGWLIYSVQTKTVTSNNQTKVEERIIEIK